MRIFVVRSAQRRNVRDLPNREARASLSKILEDYCLKDEAKICPTGRVIPTPRDCGIFTLYGRGHFSLTSFWVSSKNLA